MKANELRIGNLVLIDSDILGRVSEIRSNHAKVLYKGEVNAEVSERFSLIELIRLEPILLTEEWLVRFGGYCHESNESWMYVDIDKSSNSCIFFGFDDDYGCSLMIGKEEINLNKIKYVHQLQNLYFALTGQELEFSE